MRWFPFEVDRFLSSRKVRTMDAEDVGVYLLLMCEQWDKGSIPDDDQELEDIGRAPTEVVRGVLEACFDLEDGRWTNARLAEIHARQKAQMERRSAAGSAGAAARYQQSHATARNRSRLEVEGEKKKKHRGATVFSDEFIGLWKLHPRGSKAKAWEEFQRAVPSRVEYPKLRALLEFYVRTELSERFRGHDLFRWIRDDRWEEYAERQAAPRVVTPPKASWEKAKEDAEAAALRAFAQKHQGLRPVITERPTKPTSHTESAVPRGNITVSLPDPSGGHAA